MYLKLKSLNHVFKAFLYSWHPDEGLSYNFNQTK